MTDGPFNSVCKCVWPQRGPFYWDFACVRCNGVVRHGWFGRRKLRKLPATVQEGDGRD